MYQALKFIHLLGVFGFLLAHGGSVAVAFKLRRERDRSRIAALLQLSGSTMRWFYGSFIVLLGAGLAMTFTFHMWGQRWIWSALIVLFLSSAAMSAMARPYFARINDKLRIRASGVPQASDEEIEEILSGPQPYVLAGIGFASLLILLWLMVYKPQL